MDRILRRQLDAIADDNKSGAAELTIEAVKALRTWLRRRPAPSTAEVREASIAVADAQSQMASFLRLANSVSLTSEQQQNLPSVCRYYGNVLRNGRKRIARLFRRALSDENPLPPSFVTYSYSSTVLASLVGAKVRRVCVSEARPNLEGRKTASCLARAGVEVVFTVDMALHHAAHDESILILGADALGLDWNDNPLPAKQSGEWRPD